MRGNYERWFNTRKFEISLCEAFWKIKHSVPSGVVATREYVFFFFFLFSQNVRILHANAGAISRDITR